MILGQLIQTGRRFCECRSSDFVPDSEDEIIVIAYSIQDKFLAHSFDIELPNLKARVKDWLFEIEAVAYILIRRELHRSQTEFPFPIGREPMDRVIITAATRHAFDVVAYFLEERKNLDAYKLVPTKSSRIHLEADHANLLESSDSDTGSRQHTLFPEFTEFAS
ncbi:hypothetical protein VDG1235_3696 [Verrucomicrobiia bacterium DG1235]|nr:hypothetical protein VDG1235_3696 [Verrucomicrobiae bacterium DG1235]